MPFIMMLPYGEGLERGPGAQASPAVHLQHTRDCSEPQSQCLVWSWGCWLGVLWCDDNGVKEASYVIQRVRGAGGERERPNEWMLYVRAKGAFIWPHQSPLRGTRIEEHASAVGWGGAVP